MATYVRSSHSLEFITISCIQAANNMRIAYLRTYVSTYIDKHTNLLGIPTGTNNEPKIGQ